MDNLFTKLRQQVSFTFHIETSVINQVKEIAGYVHNLFKHDGATIPKSLSPFDIMESAKNGNSMRCVEYSFLLAALLLAYNIPARVVGLKKKTMETDSSGAGHVVVEYWDKNYEKWIMCDAQEGLIPFLNSSPLSAYELGQVISENLNVTYHTVLSTRFSANDSGPYTNWIREYLYYYDTVLHPSYTITNDERLAELKLMLIPPNTTPPTVFQGKFPINAEYTTEIKRFYRSPL